MKSLRIISIILITLATTACAPNKKLLIGMYNPNNIEGESAEIGFSRAEPYIYKKTEPTDDEMVAIRYVLGDYKDFSVSLFDDAANCVDFQVMSVNKEKEEFISIPANKMLTFRVNPVQRYEGKRVWCPNKFSFTPEPGKKYSVKLDLHSTDIEYAKCRVRVFDGQQPVEIIARENTPVFWTQTSPKCDKKEIENPAWANESAEPFQCIISRGGYKC